MLSSKSFDQELESNAHQVSDVIACFMNKTDVGFDLSLMSSNLSVRRKTMRNCADKNHFETCSAAFLRCFAQNCKNVRKENC